MEKSYVYASSSCCCFVSLLSELISIFMVLRCPFIQQMLTELNLAKTRYFFVME
jgi:hypothetical protein